MWWSSPAPLLLIAAALLVAGCGFRPLYGTGSAGSDPLVAREMEGIWVSTAPDRAGQLLRDNLVARFTPGGSPERPLWRLEIEQLIENQIDLGIRRDDTATRAQIRLAGRVRLIDHRTNQAVLVADVRTVSSYNILDSEYATRISEIDARERAVAQLADQIAIRVALHFDATRPPGS